MENKKVLRKKFMEIRNNINRESACLVRDGILKNSVYKEAKCVFCYVSLGSEPDTMLIIKEILKSDKKLCVPKCVDKNGNMIAVEIKSTKDLKDGFFGIKEPVSGEEISKENIDFCIVPGLSFDEKGFRLGYGGGYYDKFLKDNKIYTVGICFKECRSDILPTEETDISVNDVLYI